jgi:hypothetical protein
LAQRSSTWRTSIADASDETWLEDVGAKGYIVLTKDKQIRLNVAERGALVRANVRAFFLTSGNLTGAEMAEILTTQLSAMTRMARSSPPGSASGAEEEALSLPCSARTCWYDAPMADATFSPWPSSMWP